MKNKFFATTLVALCAIGAGIPVAATAATPKTAAGEYGCGYYYAGEYYCGTPLTEAQQLALEGKAGDETLGLKFYQTPGPKAIFRPEKKKAKKAKKDYYVGGHFSFKTYLKDIDKGIPKNELAATLSKKHDAIAKTTKILHGGIKKLTIDYTKGKDGYFVKSAVKKDFVVHGTTVVKKKTKVVREHFKFKLLKSGKHKDATLIVTFKKPVKNLKFVMKEGLIKQSHKDQKAAKKSQKVYLSIKGKTGNVDHLPVIKKK